MTPAAFAEESPAGIQYQYSALPVPVVSDEDRGDEAGSATEFPGNGLPLLLVGSVLLLAGCFGFAVYRRGKGDWKKALKPAVPLGLAGIVLALVLSFGASGTTAAPAPSAPRNFLGIAPQEGFTVADTKRMGQGGISSIRIAIGWDLLEPSPDDYQWGLLDSAMHDAAAQGIQILPVLYATPRWVSGKTTNLPTSPKQLAAWKDFVSDAVQRYGSKGTFWDEPEQAYIPKVPVRDWQVWNEVNFHYFATPVSASNYAKVLKAASDAIRASDPKAKVMVSGLYGSPKGRPRQALPAATFIAQLGRLVPARYIDAVALHPYSPNTQQLKLLVARFRKAMNKAGYGAKPIQITEIGWASGPKKNAFLLGSEAAQANQLTSALSFLIQSRRKYKISRVYWYTWKDSNPRGQNCSFCYTIGLFKYRKGLVPKKAWYSFVRLSGGRP